MAQKNGDFEFRLGKFGLVFFTLVIALFLLFFFICGVMVGKNIESYPQKIAAMPGTIKEKIIQGSETEPDVEKKEEEIQYTFYDTLKKSRKDVKTDVKEDFTKKKVSSAQNYTLPEKKQAGGHYLVQVASFKDKGKTETLKATLSDMGYSPQVDAIDLQSRGKWFRVKMTGFATYNDAQKAASVVQKKIKGVKCLIKKTREN